MDQRSGNINLNVGCVHLGDSSRFSLGLCQLFSIWDNWIENRQFNRRGNFSCKRHSLQIYLPFYILFPPASAFIFIQVLSHGDVTLLQSETHLVAWWHRAGDMNQLHCKRNGRAWTVNSKSKPSFNGNSLNTGAPFPIGLKHACFGSRCLNMYAN